MDAPPDVLFRDIRAVFRAVKGDWKSVNGYSGWGPSYYGALVSSARAESDAMLTPFQRLGELYVVVAHDAPRLRTLIEQQPGVTRVAANDELLVYRLPKRDGAALQIPVGQQWRPRQVQSKCSSELLPKVIDGDETSVWQCVLWDERQALTVDLGEVRTVGAVVTDLGANSWLYPGAIQVATSEDGQSWQVTWSGEVRERTILAAMADPKRLRIVLGFPPHPARYIVMRAAPGGDDIPWTIAELEVWSASAEAR